VSPSLRRHQRDWEDLGDLDPCWAVLADPEHRFGRWNLDEFFRSGEQQIASLSTDMQRLGSPARRERALDFGCGVGRLTRALSPHFRHCYGVDVSAPMISSARALNAAFHNCEFVRNDYPDLRMFPDAHFDLIYSVLVLQHLPTRPAIATYLADFARVLAPGGLLVCQVPNHIPFRRRLQLRRRLYGILRSLGIAPGVLYHRLGLFPMRMTSMPEQDVRALLTRAGGRILETRADTMASTGIESRTYYVMKLEDRPLAQFSSNAL
jgi:ubiquinone/menaquinone biosynthesis C-methylase UbiE